LKNINNETTEFVFDYMKRAAIPPTIIAAKYNKEEILQHGLLYRR